MRRLFFYLLRGLAILAPVALTLYFCWRLLLTVDHWLGVGVPGLGFLLAVLITLLAGGSVRHLRVRCGDSSRSAVFRVSLETLESF